MWWSTNYSQFPQVPGHNMPLPSSPRPLYRNEVKSSTFDMEMTFHFHADTIYFHLEVAYCKIRHFIIEETELTFAKTSGIVSRDRGRNWPIADQCVPVMIPVTIKELISALVPFSLL